MSPASPFYLVRPVYLLAPCTGPETWPCRPPTEVQTQGYVYHIPTQIMSTDGRIVVLVLQLNLRLDGAKLIFLPINDTGLSIKVFPRHHQVNL